MSFYPIAVVPPEHRFRTLVLCFDGTGNQFEADHSNVLQLFTMLKKDDRSKQMVYYQTGIGTYTTGPIATPIYSKVSKTLDMALGSSLSHHVMAGYEWLMQGREHPTVRNCCLSSSLYRCGG
jgi:uncharacterized protein (DUF2235 family)